MSCLVNIYQLYKNKFEFETCNKKYNLYNIHDIKLEKVIFIPTYVEFNKNIYIK